MRVASVNVALPEDVILGGQRLHTAIRKRPVEGPVAVGPLGLDGDGVGSPRHHGGLDQALYLYSVEDYAWWSEELGRDLAAATFGENVTLEGLDMSRLAIGDRLRFGADVVVEATAPRIPCATLAGQMSERTAFIKRFARAERPGVYVRIIEAGSVAAGDSVEVEPVAEPELTVIELMRLWYAHEAPASRLEQALKAPMAERARANLQRRLARIAAAS